MEKMSPIEEERIYKMLRAKLPKLEVVDCGLYEFERLKKREYEVIPLHRSRPNFSVRVELYFKGYPFFDLSFFERGWEFMESGRHKIFCNDLHMIRKLLKDGVEAFVEFKGEFHRAKQEESIAMFSGIPVRRRSVCK